jgi:hypothetical protein
MTQEEKISAEKHSVNIKSGLNEVSANSPILNTTTTTTTTSQSGSYMSKSTFIGVIVVLCLLIILFIGSIAILWIKMARTRGYSEV